MNNLLTIKDLTYKKNQKTILKDVNLNLTSGKIVALLGENGAGKDYIDENYCGCS